MYAIKIIAANNSMIYFFLVHYVLYHKSVISDVCRFSIHRFMVQEVYNNKPFPFVHHKLVILGIKTIDIQ